MKRKLPKKNILVKTFAALILFFIVNFANAQAANDWKLQTEQNGVKLFYKAEVCAGKNSLLLKFENTNSVNKHIICNIIIEGPKHNMPLLPKFIELKGKETKTGTCNNYKELIIDINNIINPKLLVRMIVN